MSGGQAMPCPECGGTPSRFVESDHVAGCSRIDEEYRVRVLDRAREHRGQRGYIIGMRHGKILVRLDDDTEALFLPVELTSKGVDA